MEERLVRIETHPNPNWALEAEDLPEEVEKLGERLFSLTEAETYFDPTPMEEDPEWEYEEEEYEAAERAWGQHFQFLGSEDDAARALIWQALSWDVTDGSGKELRALRFLDRMIVCSAKGLRGRSPGAPPSDEEIAERADDWGASLEAEAAKFRPKARR